MHVLWKSILITFVYACFSCSSCIHHIEATVTINPRHFNVLLPFKMDNKGIAIPTYWGWAKTKHILYLDNHSPTWANNFVIKNNSAISKSKDFLYSTTTADGKKIEGDVYLCDSILIGQVSFENVAFYNISHPVNAEKADGVIGENIMNKGVWMIDFKNNYLQVASSADSIKGLQETDLLPAVFTDNAIEIEIKFSHTITKKMELDLGYNGQLIMPEKDWLSIITGNKKLYTDSMRFSTPGSSGNIKNTVVFDSIQINHQVFTTFITTNEIVREKLIGLRFFNNFQFLAIDYPNKKVYLSKNRIDE